ncbi:MAG: DUF1015 domain-containing protein [Deltaproteobacteria bacterium]|nr:MAG: DUF1015 domain-containing protein [Deltaproteobacteria bacterium]
MATIKSFKALRPKPEIAEKVSSVPYDVVNREEAKKLAEGNPISFLHVIRPEIDLPADIDPYDDAVYNKARENFLKLVNENILIGDNEKAIYLYRLTMGDHSQIGIAACYSVDEYDRGIIKRHELTRKDKEDDRLKHMLTLSAHTGPVLLAFKSNKEINNLLNKSIKSAPLYDFTAEDNVRHTLWRITDDDPFVEVFNGLPALYIADGHHRAAGASRVKKEMIKRLRKINGDEEFNYFLAVAFPDNQLKIYPYNRHIKELNGISPEDFLEKIRGIFKVVDNGMVEPDRKGIISMYLNGKWYELHIPEDYYDHNDPVKSLDLSVFQEKVLEPILGIVDQKKDTRIDFVGGPNSSGRLKVLVDNEGGVAFAFYPVSINELMAIADAGKIMPPKSTWFAPKLRSGLLVHRF